MLLISSFLYNLLACKRLFKLNIPLYRKKYKKYENMTDFNLFKFNKKKLVDQIK